MYRGAVYSLMVLGLAHTGTSIATVYLMDVHGFGMLEQFAFCPSWFAVDPLLTAMIAGITQSFFSYRVYIVSGRRKVLPAFILVLTALQLGKSFITHLQAIHVS